MALGIYPIPRPDKATLEEIFDSPQSIAEQSIIRESDSNLTPTYSDVPMQSLSLSASTITLTQNTANLLSSSLLSLSTPIEPPLILTPCAEIESTSLSGSRSGSDSESIFTLPHEVKSLSTIFSGSTLGCESVTIPSQLSNLMKIVNTLL